MAKVSAVENKAQNLPTLEDENREIPEIQQAAASLLDVRTRRVDLTKQEKTAEDLVVKAMQKNKRDFYSFKGLEVTLESGKTKAKVKHDGDEGDGDGAVN